MVNRLVVKIDGIDAPIAVMELMKNEARIMISVEGQSITSLDPIVLLPSQRIQLYLEKVWVLP